MSLAEPGARPRMHPAYIALVVLAAVLQLVVGWLYLVSGLVVPGAFIVALLVFWVAQVVVGVRLVGRRSPWVVAVPVVGFLTWLALLWFGGEILGWTA
ncbi:MAG TPA: hypothetical protein VFD41_12785 [Actinomycetales bacterium]|nr:hypothetical protein [Actinomycetales bacterium]